jgi:anti-sigma factor RsiW
MKEHPVDMLSAYADGELTAAERLRVEDHLERCTECRRDLALIKTMGTAMRNVESNAGTDVWNGVRSRIVRSIGWALVLGGVMLWIVLAAVAWFREAFTLEWLASTAVGVGLLVLLVSIGLEQYQEWKTSPYKNIQQ